MPGTDHNNLSGTIAIHPAAFVQSTDPGAVGAGKLWVDTSSGSGLSSAPYPLKKRNSGNSGWDYIGSVGSGVSSVALTMPTGFSVSGSPITSSGTLAVTESTQSANTVKAGPTTGSAATPAYRALVAADIPTKPYVNIQDQKSSGTAGGTFTSGAWRTRDLNTKVTDTGSIASLASNQITLPAGTYRCHIIATGSQVNNHQARLQDTTGAATLLRGTTARSPANGIWATSCSEVSGLFTLSVSSVLEVQHQCSATEATDGFGIAGGFGTEVYTTVQIWKET